MVSGSAVTAEFLQQARLGKHKAPAGGSGLEKIVGAKASSDLPLDGTGNANEICEQWKETTTCRGSG